MLKKKKEMVFVHLVQQVFEKDEETTFKLYILYIQSRDL